MSPTNQPSRPVRRVALITGITGQDGSHLAEFLLAKGHEVHGVIRRASTFNTSRIDHIYQDPHDPSARLFLHYGDLMSSEQVKARIAAPRRDLRKAARSPGLTVASSPAGGRGPTDNFEFEIPAMNWQSPFEIVAEDLGAAVRCAGFERGVVWDATKSEGQRRGVAEGMKGVPYSMAVSAIP